ncbi:MAG: hypothetical protein PHX70_14120 [Clostridium sp.]|nr:hypothetical protein [Clostridium sp.]
MKKKLLASLLCVLTIFSLAGCGNSNSSANVQETTTSQTEKVQENPNEKTVDGVKFILKGASKEPVKGDRTQDNVAAENGEYFAKGSDIIKAADYENIIINLRIENSTDKAISLSEYGWTAKMSDGYKLNENMSSDELEKQIASHNDIEGKIEILVEKKLAVKQFELKYNLIDYTNFDKMIGDAISGKSEEECIAKYPELAKKNYATFNIEVQ